MDQHHPPTASNVPGSSGRVTDPVYHPDSRAAASSSGGEHCHQCLLPARQQAGGLGSIAEQAVDHKVDRESYSRDIG